MTLDLTSWQRALASLERAIVRSTAAPGDDEPRDAVIQRFEYSYELSWKMLKRHLEQVVPDPGAVDHWSFRTLMREAAERGLIAAVEPWIEYRHQRNLTAHAYDERTARRVYESSRSFIADARALLAAVERRNVD
ncbi:nucleotidyltransferase substrate binding protein [bacterium]|nr:nucleotidyltransferase substrate binding protein [bacterium]